MSSSPIDQILASQDDSVRLPKVTVTVELLLEGGLRLAGELYLTPCIHEGEGRERIVDLLVAPEPYVPLTTKTEVRLIRKQRIVRIRLDDESDTGLDGLEFSDSGQVDALIELSGVPPALSRVKGQLSWCSVPNRERLLDHLNQGAEWLPVKVENTTSLVASRYIISVLITGES